MSNPALTARRVPCPNGDCEGGTVLCQSRGPYHPTVTQPRWVYDTCATCDGEGMIEVDDSDEELGGEG